MVQRMTSAALADAPIAEVWRGDRVESVHRGRIVVVRAGATSGEELDDVIWSLGDPRLPVYARSAVKPFQALPTLELGIADRLGFGDAELALLSASHDGTDYHVEVVRRMLARGGLREEDLGCGPHSPFDKRAGVAIARGGGKPLRVHNNCSGKHTGFLLLACEFGVELADYLEPAVESQRQVRNAVAEMAGLQAADLDHAIDGCGAPTLRLPLLSLARAFGQLVNPAGLAPVRRMACQRLFAAISAEPVALAGQSRLCTALVESARARIYPKNGAEGVYAFGALTAAGPVGVAIKVSDGQERAYQPVVVGLLRWLGLWGEIPASLTRFAPVPLHNTQKRLVGEVRSVVVFPDRC